MPIFEYKIVDFRRLQRDFRAASKRTPALRRAGLTAYIEQRWNELGDGGWELVGVGTADQLVFGCGGTTRAVYYFKRPRA